MNETQIDELLTRYEAAEGRIASNLVELDAHPTYKILSTGSLQGETLAQLGTAMAAAPNLWGWLSSMREVVGEAREVREGGRLNNDRKKRLADLLSGPSVLLSLQVTPLAERDLVGTAENELRVTIDQLLTKMREVYEPVRDGVAEVDRRWREVLPRLDSASTTLARLQAEVTRLGIVEPLVSELDRRLASTRNALMDDPLGLSATAGTDLDGLVSRAAAQVGELGRGHDELDDDLAGTEAKLAELRVLRARAEAAYSETATKITDPGDLIRLPSAEAIDGPAGLASRADTIRSDTTTPWLSRRTQLDGLLDTITAMRSQLTRAYDANHAPVQRRDELRGLLSALWAKAAGVGRAEDPLLSDLHDEAHNELFTAPTDLTRAETLVGDFATAIRAPAPTPTGE